MKSFSWFSVTLFFILLYSKAFSATVLWPSMEVYSYGTYNNVYSCLLNSTVPSYIAGVQLDISHEAGAQYTLRATPVTAATGIVLYRDSFGDAVDANSAAAVSPLADNITPQTGTTQITGNQVFYLCFWMGNGGGGTAPGAPGSVYGWVSLIWNGTALTVKDSAAETTGVGIYAGTYNAIPEPATAGLLLAGLSALALRRRLAGTLM